MHKHISTDIIQLAQRVHGQNLEASWYVMATLSELLHDGMLAKDLLAPLTRSDA
jgi:hypothetical protein